MVDMVDMNDENRCSSCGGSTYESMVKTCLWEDVNVFIVEDIPARICEKCFEQFYDGDTVLQIERLRRDGFPRKNAKEVIGVPVFSLNAMKKPARIKKKGKGARDTENPELNGEINDPAANCG
jgi:YgiT-type zinc finger domain-containing protein